jgi:hypothetical protein
VSLTVVEFLLFAPQALPFVKLSTSPTPVSTSLTLKARLTDEILPTERFLLPKHPTELYHLPPLPSPLPVSPTPLLVFPLTLETPSLTPSSLSSRLPDVLAPTPTLVVSVVPLIWQLLDSVILSLSVERMVLEPNSESLLITANTRLSVST